MCFLHLKKVRDRVKWSEQPRRGCSQGKNMWVPVTPGDNPSEQHCSDGDLSFTAFHCSTKKVLPAHDVPGSDLMGTDNMAFRANWHWRARYLQPLLHIQINSYTSVLTYTEICCREAHAS